MRGRLVGLLAGLGLAAGATGWGVAAALRPAPEGDPRLPPAISVPAATPSVRPPTSPPAPGPPAQGPSAPQVVDPPPAVDVAPAQGGDVDSADSPDDDGDDDG